MSEVKFDSVNTAAYSPRPNTPAATWTNQLSEPVKSDRLQRINRLNLAHAAERRARMVGREVEVRGCANGGSEPSEHTYEADVEYPPAMRTALTSF